MPIEPITSPAQPSDWKIIETHGKWEMPRGRTVVESGVGWGACHGALVPRCTGAMVARAMSCAIAPAFPSNRP